MEFVLEDQTPPTSKGQASGYTKNIAALRTATGCTQDTNIQFLHDETLILPIHEHTPRLPI